jgi:uncharacterized membrane protein YkoI
MKIVLTTTALVALLAIGLIGINNNNSNNDINNAYAQENDETKTMANQSKGGGEGMEGMMKLNGTVNVESTIAEALKSKITTDIIGAIEAAQASVGTNSFVKEAELTDAHGYLVYKIKVVDENLKKYKVIVDPGNGQVLMKKEITWYEDEHEKMKYGDEERYDKYSGSHDYKDDKYGNHGYGNYDKEKMMMKEKEY